MVSLTLFASIIPFGSFLMGFATAVCAQTAWYLVVPVCFVGFDMPIFHAIFISLSLDLFNGIALSLFNGYRGYIDWKYGTFFGVIAAVASLPPSILLRTIIEHQVDLVKFTASFIPAVMAIAFLVKGIRLIKAEKKAKKIREKLEHDKILMKKMEIVRKKSSVINVNPKAVEEQVEKSLKSSGLDSLDESDSLLALPLRDPSHSSSKSKLSSQRNYQPLEEELEDMSKGDQRQEEEAEEEEAQESVRLRDEESGPLKYSAELAEDSMIFADDQEAHDLMEKNLEEELKEEHWKVWKSRTMLLNKRTPVIFRKFEISFKWVLFLSVLGHLALGLFMGILYVGGGIFFAFLTSHFWDSPLKTSFCTGVYSMTIALIAICCTFVTVDGIFHEETAEYFGLSVPFGIVGALLGARLADKVSGGILNIVISLTSFAVAGSVLINAFSNL